MSTLYYSHDDFLTHDTGPGHPESAQRLRAISKALQAPEFSGLQRKTAVVTTATWDHIRLIHPQQHIDYIVNAIPQQDLQVLDNDTIVSPGSGNAALAAVAAVCEAIDCIFQQQNVNAFCAVRPPGHHATPNRAMGFCLYNNIAIAAAYARQQYALQRVAIVDFDVHHGNGTQAAFDSDTDVLFISSHEMPNYPGTGYPSEKGVGNIINIPLAAMTSGAEFRQLYRDIALPALHRFKPQLLLISAGFDAHKDDPLASIQLVAADYQWITSELLDIAKNYSQGRLLSVLEGGYNLQALAASAATHVQALMQ